MSRFRPSGKSAVICILAASLLSMLAVAFGPGVADSPAKPSSRAPSEASNRPAAQPATRAATQPTTQPGATFKLATYNVHYRNINLKAMVETIRTANADVVALQEVTAGSARAIRRHLKRKYPHMRFRSGRWAEGFAWLSKIPLRKLKWLPKKHGAFGTWLAEVTPGGGNARTVQLANVHLHATIPPRNGGLRALAAKFARTERIRAREIAHIYGKLSKKLPVIILGDLNSLSLLKSKVTAFLAANGLADSFASVHVVPDSHPTFRTLDAKRRWQFRLDYIFHDVRFRTVSSTVIPSNGSDHFLLVSELAFADATATTQPGETSP